MVRNPNEHPITLSDEERKRLPEAHRNLPPEMLIQMEAHLDFLTVRNYSNATVRERRYYIGLLISWADERGLTRTDEFTLALLESYQRHVFHLRKANGQPLKIMAQISRLVNIRLWFKWLERTGRLPTNPARDMVMPRKPKHLPRAILTREEVERLLAQPNLRKPSGIRDRAIMETFYATAIRRSELISLTLSNVDFDRRKVQILDGKGQKDRFVPIGQRALDWLAFYLEHVRPLYARDEQQRLLFLTQPGNGLTGTGVSDLVKRHLRKAGIEKPGCCHLFRHSAATQMLEAGADVRALQSLLGHSSLAATQVYTHISINYLREVYDKTHPAKVKPRPLDADNSEDDNDGDLVPC